MKEREKQDISTTMELAKIVEKVIPRKSAKSPATRVFQALRMEVNRELEVLERALDESVNVLASGGVLAVITFSFFGGSCW